MKIRSIIVAMLFTIGGVAAQPCTIQYSGLVVSDTGEPLTGATLKLNEKLLLWPIRKANSILKPLPWRVYPYHSVCRLPYQNYYSFINAKFTTNLHAVSGHHPVAGSNCSRSASGY